MIKAILRLIGLLVLALALITAVLDIARSIADSTLVITPLGKDWFDLSVDSLNLAQAVVQRYLHPMVWDPFIQSILQLPRLGGICVSGPIASLAWEKAQKQLASKLWCMTHHALQTTSRQTVWNDNQITTGCANVCP